MKTSSNGIDLIKHYEGCETEAYLCPANVWTIGYGHIKGVQEGDVITEQQAHDMLVEELNEYEEYVNTKVMVDLNQDQFDALVSWVYNLGSGNFTSSTLLKVLNSGDYAGVPEQILRWNKANGQVLEGLSRRRESEAELFSGA
jgi:lysozyme